MSAGSKVEWMFSRPTRPPQARSASITVRPLGARGELNGLRPTAKWALEQSAFDELLNWLGPDPEAAGRNYELIRHKLITIFTCRGCAFPEDLADEAINRVIRKLPQIKSYYSGNPALYFYGVAKRVCKEYFRSLSVPQIPPTPAAKEDREDLLQQLDDALSQLERDDRELILNYYREDKWRKTEHRRAIAKQMGVGLNALRLRVYRIRCQLRTKLFDNS